MTSMTFPSHFVHHEDIITGATRAFGRYEITKEQIFAFARTFDPQPMHLDEVAARASIAGGLCASGFHTCAILMRMMCDGVILTSASLGSPGVDEVRWLKPVRPGDVLSVRGTWGEKRVSASRPHVGISKSLFELLNADGDVVATLRSNQMLALRNPPKVAPPASGAAAPPKAVQRVASLWDEPAASAPQPSRTSNYFEDRTVGELADLGQHTFERDDIIAFARAFDPQLFHLDEEVGRRSLFGGLSASGWHTASVFVRKLIDWRQAVEAEIRGAGGSVAAWGPSPGFKDCRWLKPVLAGDTISFRNQTSALIPLKSRPDRGLVVAENQGRNQKGEIVFLITTQVLAERST